MSKKKIDFYFKKDVVPQANQTAIPLTTVREKEKVSCNIESPVTTSNIVHRNESLPESSSKGYASPPKKIARIESDSEIVDVERDPGKRKMIWEYPVNKRDDIRRKYLAHGPYQVKPWITKEARDKNGRKFNYSWYDQFRDWLEYSPSTYKAYCFPCFLFGNMSAVFGSNAFVVSGFQTWKKVNDGANCAFRTHEGFSPNFKHKDAIRSCHALMNSLQHVDKIIHKQELSLVERNRLRVHVSINATKVCGIQGIAFRGHDERSDSRNPGNFKRLIKLASCYNDDVAAAVLENAPQNATYASHQIQKEILSLYRKKIQKSIRDEIGAGKFCIIVDESRDESKKEQMAIILRFVDKEGFIRERFLDIVHVVDTKAITLKSAICKVLAHHNLDIHDIRGQGYDGASNMRGEWNGLQALFLSECPYAYYIHCFAHCLQLVLVATCQSVVPVEHFFSHLVSIINVVDVSPKRHDELQLLEAIRIEELISTKELETGIGKNQTRGLPRPTDTRWSSHLRSMHGVLHMYDSVLKELKEICDDKSCKSSRSAADGAFEVMMTFEFSFILHFLIELLGRTDDLCRMMQCKSQDILNAMDVVSNTKSVIQIFREKGWDELLKKVSVFCEKRAIQIPDMNSPRTSSRGRVLPGETTTWAHHYRIDIFYGTIDSILQEMNFRFKEEAVELLRLSVALDPRGNYQSFDINDICKLAEKFYSADFTNEEQVRLKYQLEIFELDIRKNAKFQEISTLSDLCQLLSKTGKSAIYPLIDRLIRLVLILPVSTATSERAFSSMKIVKPMLRNKMDDDFLSCTLLMYIENEIAQSFDVSSMVDEFNSMKKRRSQLKIRK